MRGGRVSPQATAVMLCTTRYSCETSVAVDGVHPPLSASSSSHSSHSSHSIHGFYCSGHKVHGAGGCCLHSSHVSPEQPTSLGVQPSSLTLAFPAAVPVRLPSFLPSFRHNRLATGCTPCALGRSASRRGRKEGGHDRSAPVLPSKGKCRTTTHAPLLRLLLSYH